LRADLSKFPKIIFSPETQQYSTKGKRNWRKYQAGRMWQKIIANFPVLRIVKKKGICSTDWGENENILEC
jgi:hypothetical protein